MNWLEEHLRNFVYPHLKVYHKAYMKFGRNGVNPVHTEFFREADSVSLEPFTGTLRPMKEAQFAEAGQLAAFLKAHHLWHLLSTKTLDAFYDFQIEKLGTTAHDIVKYESQKEFTKTELLHTLLKNSVKDLRKKYEGSSQKVFFLGRDVWTWYVLAQKMGLTNCHYDARVSRNIASNQFLVRELAKGWGIKKGDVIFDTGFAGSIHRRIQEATGLELKCLMLSSDITEVVQFPNYGPARNRALVIEYAPKYFTTGKVIYPGYPSYNKNHDHLYFKMNDAIVPPENAAMVSQCMSPLNEFVGAALLTIMVYNFQSPNWIPGPKGKVKPKQGETKSKITEGFMMNASLSNPYEGMSLGEMLKKKLFSDA